MKRLKELNKMFKDKLTVKTCVDYPGIQRGGFETEIEISKFKSNKSIVKDTVRGESRMRFVSAIYRNDKLIYPL